MQKQYLQKISKSKTCFKLKLKLPRLLLALPIILGSHAALALDIVPANSSYYYAMGGGSDVSLPPVTDQQDITIGGDVNTNLGGSCGFNPSISIANTISNIQDSLQGLQQSVIGSATSAVGSMPMYLLSKSNKDLYNLLQNTLTSASETFHLSMKSCQDAMNQISSGKSPYQDWFSVSDSQGWLNSSKRAAQGQDVDINDTKQQLTKDPEQYGIPWVHADQNSGGTTGNQVPIKVIYDVAVAGYNVTVDPTLPLDSKTTAATPGLGLAQYWLDADAAGQWARLVLGDITISSEPGEDDTARGVGLMTLVQTCPDGATNQLTCAKTIAENLASIVSSNAAPTAEQLKSVSSTEMMATVSLINGIRNKNVEDRTIAISKWAQDVALQNVVGEELTLRRILIAGSQTKPVHNLAPALTMVTTSINQLDKDIEDILFQFRVRRELMSNTASVILGDQAQAESNAVGDSTETQTPEMMNGAIYKSDN